MIKLKTILNEDKYEKDFATYKKQFDNIVKRLTSIIPRDAKLKMYNGGVTAVWTREISKNDIQYFSFGSYPEYNFKDANRDGDWDPAVFHYGGSQSAYRSNTMFNAIKTWFTGTDVTKSKHHNGKAGGVQASLGLFANKESESKIISGIKPILAKIFTDTAEY